MNNPKSPKERNLLKGAIRRVFSRSELRRKVLEAGRIEHSDPGRPRVTKWGRCEKCKQPTALYQMQVDHIIPLVPLDKNLEEMSWGELVDRAWCDERNLAILCRPCHNLKSKAENSERRKLKKERLNGKPT